MNNLIEKQAAIDALCSECQGRCIPCDSYPCSEVDAINALPSAQLERKKGKWERVYFDHVAFGERPSIFYCSSCNQCIPFPTNFCPACGSDNRQS